ncbi:MAG: hypothetical protein IRZ08_05600, partial [Frankia sp.]|nr:hypothetical protein [Frankia sp.]
MRPFDADDYRKRVLAPVHARGGVEHTDPFEIYDIPLEEAGSLDDAAVADRISTVWAFWQRSRDHPRYRGLILSLLARHQELAGTLAGRAERVALAARVAAARQARDSERFAAFEAAVARIVERFGGLPADKLPGLRRIAADAGMDDAEFERRIARHRSLPAGASERTGRRPVPPEVFRQVRADLDELGKIIGDGAPRSLFELLGLAPGVSRDLIRRERDALAARNRERRPDRRRALIDDLLAAVTTLLVDGDPEAYLDALAAAATERLRPRMEAAILVEDRLTPADAAELVTAAEYEGLDRARAVAVVRALARELGADDSVVPGPGAGSTSGPGPARAAGPRPPGAGPP